MVRRAAVIMGARAHHKLGLKDQRVTMVATVCDFPVQIFEQYSSSSGAHSLPVRTQRRERWRHQAGEENIIRAGHGHVMRNSATQLRASTQRASSDEIVVADDASVPGLSAMSARVAI